MNSSLQPDAGEISTVLLTSPWLLPYVGTAAVCGVACGLLLFVVLGLSSRADPVFAITVLFGGIAGDFAFRRILRRKLMLVSRPAIAAVWIWPVLAAYVALLRPFEHDERPAHVAMNAAGQVMAAPVQLERSGASRGPCGARQVEAIALAYAALTANPGGFSDFVAETGGAYDKAFENCATAVGSALIDGAVRLPTADQVYSATTRIANDAGRPDLARPVADSIGKDRSDQLRVGSYIQQLPRAVALARKGDDAGLAQLEQVNLAVMMWQGIMMFAESPAEVEAYRTIMFEVQRWYVGALASGFRPQTR